MSSFPGFAAAISRYSVRARVIVRVWSLLTGPSASSVRYSRKLCSRARAASSWRPNPAFCRIHCSLGPLGPTATMEDLIRPSARLGRSCSSFSGLSMMKKRTFVFATMALISGNTLGSKVVTEKAVGFPPNAYG
jgi:hypothetical protein